MFNNVLKLVKQTTHYFDTVMARKIWIFRVQYCINVQLKQLTVIIVHIIFMMLHKFNGFISRYLHITNFVDESMYYVIVVKVQL